MKKKIIKSVLALLLIITLIIGIVIIYYKTPGRLHYGNHEEY